MRSMLSVFVVLALSCFACLAQPVIVCTTTIVGDVVSQLAGSDFEVKTLLPVGADPHSFEPTPQDLVTLASATLIFSNGAELEETLEAYLESAEAPVISLADGLELLPIDVQEEQHHEDEDHEEEEEEAQHDHGFFDPHVWFDPTFVSSWTETIERELAAILPASSADIATRGSAYRLELQALDTWIMETVSVLPTASRNLVTDHSVFAYFAARYGFTQAGAILPGGTTASEPSAKDLAEVIDTIRALDVSVIFVGEVISSALVAQVAQDTGTDLVFIYTGSLSDRNGPAANYIDLMKYNVQAIVDALIKES